MVLEKVIDPDERVLWSGRPHALLYIIGNPLIYLVAIAWLMFDLNFIRMFTSISSLTSNGSSITGAFVPFIILHLFPVWYAIGSLIYRAIAWHKVEYAFTNKRVYRGSGIFGADVSSLELREISNLTVSVNPVENLLGLGTIRLTPDVSTGNGRSRHIVQGYRFKHVRDPYELYDRIKKASLDVSTDQQYPNAYRPDGNPGYHTDYREKG